VGGFELCGADHAKRPVESSLVVPVDPAGGGVFDVGQRLVGAVVEDRGADALGLVEPVDALHQGIVGIADAADRGPDAFEVEVLGQPDRGVLGDPASEWWIRSEARIGWSSWSRCQIAIRSGVRTMSVALLVEVCQARIRCEYTSTMNVDCSRFYGHGFRRRVRECFYSLVRILQVSSIRAWSGA